MPWTKGANRRTLKNCRESGVTHVQILPANLEGHACVRADELATKPIPLDQVPELPLTGCDADSCGCIWTSYFEPLTEEQINEINSAPFPFDIRIRDDNGAVDDLTRITPPPSPQEPPLPGSRVGAIGIAAFVLVVAVLLIVLSRSR